jgi:uncharacterized membrane protein
MSEESPSSSYPNNASSTTSSDAGDNTIMMMGIFCGVGIVIFGLVYFTFWKRGKRNDKAMASSRETEEQEQEQQQDGNNDEEANNNNNTSSSSSTPARQRINGNISYVHELEERERLPGDPIYDGMIIGGTLSLAIIMLVGATVVLIVSLLNQSKYNDASLTDFISLGNNGCQVLQNASRYSYFDQEVNALTTICTEQWEYTLRIHNIINDGNERGATNATTTYFVSAPVTHGECRGTCRYCLQAGELYGPNFYARQALIDPRISGLYIDEQTYVECWQPTIPVEDLSGFYDCGVQRSENGTCFLLQDTAVQINEESESTQIGLVAVYACFAGGFLLLLLVVFFKYRNRQVKEAQRMDGETVEDANAVVEEEEEEDSNVDGIDKKEKEEEMAS